jgi:glycosyltransferase involved in cell wall biosynthesis
MENLDLVSVIMPMFNDAKYIKQSIFSVLNQTYEKLELLIVDDCSSDDCYEIVGSISDSRIRLFKNDKNCGAAFSRNVALNNAKGRWIAFLDADDVWSLDKLSKQIAFMNKNNSSFSYSRYYQMDENGKLTGTQISGPRKITRRVMHHICYPGCLTIMYDANVVGKINVDPSIKKRNDDAVMLQVIRKTNCLLCDEPLAFYRIRKGSISHVSKIQLLSYHYRVYRIVEHRSSFGAAFCAFRNFFFYFWKKLHYVKRVNISSVVVPAYNCKG